MKKVLTIAVVALLATATLFAGVNFSGRFRQGYVFAFEKDEDAKISPWKTEEAKLVLKVSDDNNIWTVNVKNVGALDSNDKWSANASLNLTNALAAGGIDTGDFSLAVSLGANERMTALSAYTDPTGNEYYKLKNNGKESMQVAFGYGDLIKFNVAFDPTKNTTTTASSMTVIDKEAHDKLDDKTGYVDMGNGYYYKMNPSKTTVVDPSVVLSVMSTPINGVSVAAAYAYNGWFADPLYGANETTYDHSIGFSADVNIAKLVGLDFNLGVTAFDNVAFQKETPAKDVEVKYTTNSFAAAVYGGVDFIDAFAEFTMANYSNKSTYGNQSKSDNQNFYGLNMQVNLNVIENLALDVYYNIANIEKAGDNFSIGGDVAYTLAGVEFGLNVDYTRALNNPDADSVTKGTFSLTPKMIIVF